MRRLAGALGAVLLALLAAALWLRLGTPAPMPARFAAEECRRLDLPGVVGAEDLAVLPDGRVLISAYDRLAVERAAKGGGDRPPDGDLHLLDEEGVARPLVDHALFDGGFRPHGLAVRGDAAAVVNRRLVRGVGDAPRAWSPRTTIELFELDGEELRHVRTLDDPAFCRANDLAFHGARLLVTLDHGDCARPWRELLFSGAGEVIAAAIEPPQRPSPVVRGGLDFANGIVATPGGPLVAETRGFRLSGPAGIVDLPGGPDNLTQDGAGVVAAMHPSLIRMGLHRNGWTGRAPSRVARVQNGAIEILFDDPAGGVFSAATVGAFAGGRLYVGSVTEAGLLVCEAAEAAP